MLLTAIRHYMAGRGPVRLGQLAQALDVEPEVARSALATWIRKGRVQELTAVSGCTTGCKTCRAPAWLPQDPVFLWVESEARTRAQAPGPTGEGSTPQAIE
jgi:hypothetical protein